MSSKGTNADVVVIGSGASGLSAAVTAAEGGAKVVLFEKQRALGGTSNYFEGTFAVESEMQRKKFVTYSRDQAFKSIMDYSHWRANARLVRVIVDESAGTILWLQQQGVEFLEVARNLPNSPETCHVINGHGAAVVKALALKGKEKGIIFKLGSPVKRLLKEGGRISGVVAEENEDEVEVSAKVVIIASGGYVNNKEWMKKYAGFDLDANLTPVGNVGKMGDGIRMAWQVGAGEEGIGTVELYRVGPVGPDFVIKSQLEMVVLQPDLWVDPRGERFCDEGICFSDTPVGNVNARYKEGYTFTVFDDTVKKRLMEQGIDKNMAWDYMPGARPVDLDRDLQIAFGRGSETFGADSIEELAGKMGVDPEVLKATIDEYNSSCEKGHDHLFAKDRRFLRPLRGPKFYAIKARTIALGTLGGIKINHKAEVVDKMNQSIPGLYAGGLDAGGMYGDSYPFDVASGLASGFALNSGRIAGKNALKYLGK